MNGNHRTISVHSEVRFVRVLDWKNEDFLLVNFLRSRFVLANGLHVSFIRNRFLVSKFQYLLK